MFKLQKLISLQVDGKEIVGKLVGIDHYVMESFSGKACSWPSYTLTSERKGKFSRYWFVKWPGAQGPWILWTKAGTGRVPKGARIILEKSGIARISFEGDCGASTPYAALAQYAVGKKGYFCLERFAGSKAMFFSGVAIAKPKAVLG